MIKDVTEDVTDDPNPSRATLTRSPLSDGEWHRLHPLTPVLRGGLVLVVVLGIVIANLRERLIYLFVPGLRPDIPEWDDEEWVTGDPVDWVIANNLYWLAVVFVLGLLVLLIAWYYLSWRFHTFRITGDQVEVRSGVLFRTQRRAPLDRVQGVNLTRPMIARLLGAAKLQVVGAGIDGNVKLEYLSTADAEAVRADILRLASGRTLDGTSAPSPSGRPRSAAIAETVTRGVTGLIEGDDSQHAEPESVVQIPAGRLVASHVLSGTTFFLIAAIVVTIVLLTRGVPWVLFGFVPMILGVGAYWFNSIVKSLRYSIAPTPDGVRITFGLFTTITEILPPGRIHAVEVSQPLLWRPAGWWRVRINRLSGRSVADTASATDPFTTVLPVGTHADVERVLGLILPALSPDERALIADAGARGTGPAGGFMTTPRRAWFIRPFRWRRNGFLLTPDALLMRRGAIWRSLTVLPLARLQSIGITQGPVDRAVRVANIHGHVVMGPVTAILGAIDRDAALALFGDLARGTVAAVAADRAHRWAAPDAEASGWENEADAPGLTDDADAPDGADAPIERGGDA